MVNGDIGHPTFDLQGSNEYGDSYKGSSTKANDLSYVQ